MDPVIKILTEEDWKIYQEAVLLALESDPAAFAISYEQANVSSEQDLRKRLSSKSVYTVQVDGRIAALCGVQLDRKARLAHSAVIGPFFTLPDFRQKGFASMLLEQVIGDLHANPDILKIILHVNEPQAVAKSLYEKAGFREVGRLTKEVALEGIYYDQFVMEYLFEDKF